MQKIMNYAIVQRKIFMTDNVGKVTTKSIASVKLRIFYVFYGVTFVP